MKEPLTASRMNALAACPRKHYYSYELGLHADKPAEALAFGSAWHEAMEMRWNGATLADTLQTVTDRYTPEDPSKLRVLRALIAGYFTTHETDTFRDAYKVVPEQEFALPIDGSRTFEARGKIDGVAIANDGGETVLFEHKTCGESIEPTSDYWTRLTYNTQLLQYVLAARACGFDVSRVVYDVARKPLLKVKNGETFDAYEERLVADILSRPEFYFARRTVDILDEDLDEFADMRAQIAKQILYFRGQERKAVERGRHPECGWPRACTALNCRGCEFSGFCLSRIHVGPDNVPSGFIVTGPTPELSNTQN